MDRFLSWPQLKPLITYSRQHVGRLEAKGLFPARRRLSANRVAWVESEVEEWIANREPGGPPQADHLRSKAPPEPDAEDVEMLRRLASKHGFELTPSKPERRRPRGGP
jgi:prophage regulatory protein